MSDGTGGTAIQRDPKKRHKGRYADYRREDDPNCTENSNKNTRKGEL